MKARKLVSMALALIMLLTACSALADFTPVPVGERGTGTREYVEPPEGDWLQPYSEIVNIRTVKGQGSDVVFENGEDQSNNYWIRGWYNDLGIEVTYDWIDEGNTQYTQKLNMTIATGDLPDVFRCNYVTFRQLVKAGALQDITEVYEKYACQRVKDYEKTDPDTIKTCMVDGKLFGVPIYYYGVIDNPRYMWVRKDWYEEEGSPELKTVEDFEKLAHTLMEKHGCYGISIANTFEHLFMTGPMFNVYLGNPDQGSYYWYKDADGRIKAGIAHPEFKTALTYWAKWYQDGILSPDFVNKTFDDMNEDVVNGKAAFQPYYQWQGWQNGPNLVAAQGSNDAYMIPLQFPTIDGSQVLGQVGFPNADIVVVSKDCKNPAAAMKLINYTDHIMFDPSTVLTEEEFKGFTDGQREHIPGAFEVIDPQADMIQFEHVLKAIETGDTSELFTSGMKKKYGDSMMWINEKNTGGLGAYLQQGFEGCAYYNAKYLLDNNYVKKTDMWGPPPEEFDETVNTIDIITTGVSEIIMGIRPVDDYDQILADWYAAGGQIMEDAVNKYYNVQ